MYYLVDLLEEVRVVLRPIFGHIFAYLASHPKTRSGALDPDSPAGMCDELRRRFAVEFTWHGCSFIKRT